MQRIRIDPVGIALRARQALLAQAQELQKLEPHDGRVDVPLRHVQALAGAQMRFTCQRRNGDVMPDLAITLNLAGEHNVRNALAAALKMRWQLTSAPSTMTNYCR